MKLIIGNKRYSSWSLRPWLGLKVAGIPFEEELHDIYDPGAAADRARWSPTGKVPLLADGELLVWDTLAIAEYLHEIAPEAGLLPADQAVRAHCRAVSGEIHSGFYNLRSALPMNIKGHYPGFKVWQGAQTDIDRVLAIWRGCFTAYKGPFLFGETPSLADAMYAPVCSRFKTYDVKLDAQCAAYRDMILERKSMQEWTAGAMEEPDELEELDVEF